MTRSLKNRLSVILALVLTVSGLTSLLILKVAIAPAFSTLEAQDAQTDLGRAEQAIGSQLQQLKAIAGDWAPWDEPYAFAEGKNPDFIYRNIDLSTLRNIQIELMQFFDRDGTLLWSGYVDRDDFAEIGTLGRLGEGDPLYALLTGHPDVYSVVSGLLMTARGPMLLVSLPLVVEAGQGPVAGTIVIGRILTDERLAKIRDDIKVPFEIVPLEQLRADEPSLLRELGDVPTHAAVHTVGEAYITSYRLLNDLSGSPLGVLQSRTARDVTALGQRAANLALLLFVVLGLLLVSLIWLLLRKDIVNPLERLAAHMVAIRESGDLSAKIATSRDDEIGRLGQEFNSLTGELQQLRQQLVEQSFKAGKADTAAEVLHNIRNAMTPVVNAADAVSRTLRDVASLRLKQAADELDDPDCPAERRAGLLRYVAAAAERLRQAGANAGTDVELICRQARLVEEIVAGQESVTRAAPVREKVDLAEVVAEATAVLPRGMDSTVDLHVGPELVGLAVTANRVQLLQIVGNVVLNAYESIRRAGRNPGRIDVNAEAGVDALDRVRLSVTDNGAGLSAEQLTRIFQRGFTSKTGSHSGLGLHWCANTLNASGGSIRVESRGPDQGATVHIELPAVAASASVASERPAGPHGQASGLATRSEPA